MISRVGHLHIIVRGPDGSDAIAAKDALQAAVRDALVALERDLGGEVLFVRDLSISLRAIRVGNARPDWRVHVDRILRSELNRLRQEVRAKAGTATSIIDENAAWFVSEGAYFAEALLRRTPHGPSRASTTEWVFAGLGARDVVEILQRAPRIVAADAIAVAAARCAETHRFTAADDGLEWIEVVEARFASLEAERLLAILLPADGLDAIAAVLGASGADVDVMVPAAARTALRVLRSSASPARRLAALAVWFAIWPAARSAAAGAWAQPAKAQPALAPPRTAAGARAEPAEQQLASAPLRTEALVLLVAASEAPAYLEAPGAVYDEREARAVRWVIARAIAQPRVSPYDPLVLLFADEEPTARPHEAVLRELDPEPLHAAAVRAAAALHDASLRMWRSGDRAYVLAGEVCVDYLDATRAESVGEVVQRYAGRAGAPPRALTPLTEPPSRDIDLVLAADLPSLPDPWRGAVLAVVSALRAHLRANGVDAERISGCSGELHRVGPRQYRLVAPGATRALLAPYVRRAARLGRFTVELAAA